MTAGGRPAGDGRRAGDPTVPLPAGAPGYDTAGYGAAGYDGPAPDYDVPGYAAPGYGVPRSGVPGRGGGGAGYGRGPYRAGRRGGRSLGRRLLRRAAVLVLVLILLAAVAFGGLLILTPSVGNARALVRAQNRRHHAVYPGPPVPARFASALEATEDHRFTEEPGVDPIAVGRVFLGELTGHGDQGGATLYQQLAKVLYTQGRSSAADEVKQVALAVKLKFSYSSQEVLQMYASVVYFGHGFYGLAAASCGYFGTTPAGMSWPQAALAAGLVQGPTVDDPLHFPVAARAREEHVIGRLVATGTLTPAQAATALAVPLRRLLAHAGQGCAA